MFLASGRWRARRGRWWRSKGVRLLPHEAHQRWLGRSKLLSHQRLWPPRWKRSRSRSRWLAELTVRLAGHHACTWLGSAMGVVTSVAAVTLILIRAGVVTIPVIPTPEGGWGGGGGAVSISPVVAAKAAAIVFTAAAPTASHAAITLLLVHEVRVVGAAATVTHTATWHSQEVLDQYHSRLPKFMKCFFHFIVQLRCNKIKKQWQVVLTASSTTIRVHQLKQFGVDSLPRLFQNPDQVSGLTQVPRGEERVGGALVGAACCTSNTVDVILRRAGIVVVDDELDIFNIFLGKEQKIFRARRKVIRKEEELLIQTSIMCFKNYGLYLR